MKIFKKFDRSSYRTKITRFFQYFSIALLLVSSFHFWAFSANSIAILGPIWTVSLEARKQPIATDKQLFVMGMLNYKEIPSLSAIDSKSGNVQWKHPLLPQGNYNHLAGQEALVIENGTIYSGHAKGVMGFDTETGSLKSSLKYVELKDRYYDNLMMGVSQGMVVYGRSFSSGNSSYRLEVYGNSPEKNIWSYKPQTHSGLGINLAHDTANPVIQNGILFLPSYTDIKTVRLDQFTAIDVATGKVIWKWESPKDPDGLYSARVFGDTIYASTWGNAEMKPSGKLRAIDLKTGIERWSYAITGRVKLASDREVFVWQSNGNTGNNFVVLDKQTGEFLRKFELPRVYSNEPKNLTLSNDLIYAPDMEIVRGRTKGGFYGDFDNNSWVSAFDAKTGKLVWRTSTLLNSHIYSAPIVSGDKLIVASNFLRNDGNSKVLAFQIPKLK